MKQNTRESNDVGEGRLIFERIYMHDMKSEEKRKKEKRKKKKEKKRRRKENRKGRKEKSLSKN
jgi:hypothetical protein